MPWELTSWELLSWELILWHLIYNKALLQTWLQCVLTGCHRVQLTMYLCICVIAVHSFYRLQQQRSTSPRARHQFPASRGLVTPTVRFAQFALETTNWIHVLNCMYCNALYEADTYYRIAPNFHTIKFSWIRLRVLCASSDLGVCISTHVAYFRELIFYS